MKNLTPLEAIRCKCLNCSYDAPHEVRNCINTKCALFAYRKGKRQPEYAALLKPCKTIRQYCLKDCEADAIGVKECVDPRCALYHFRFGKNPNFHITEERREILIKRLSKALPLSECQESHQSPSEIKVSPENPIVSGKEE